MHDVHVKLNTAHCGTHKWVHHRQIVLGFKLEQFIGDDLVFMFMLKVGNIAQFFVKLNDGHSGKHTDTKISDKRPASRGPHVATESFRTHLLTLQNRGFFFNLVNFARVLEFGKH